MRILRIFGFVPWFMAAVPSMAADHFPVAAKSVTLIVGKDGQVYASGDVRPNRGDTSEVLRKHFEPIAGLKDIVSVDVGGNDGAVALDKDGEVWLWGRYWCDVVRGKELDETDDCHVPCKHPGLCGIRSVDLGNEQLIALHKDGRVLTIGSSPTANAHGALGNGTLRTPESTAPNFGVIEVAGITDAVAIAAGGDASFILRSDGTVWGMGSRLMLGESLSTITMLTDPDFQDRIPVSTPQRIEGLQSIKAISAGRDYAIALDGKGNVWGWGTNDSGQIGKVISDTNAIAPRKLSGLNNIVSISAGSDFLLAADSSGRVFARGGNSYGTLGSGDFEDEGKLKRVPNVDNAKLVVAGKYSAFAVLADNSIMGWGCNDPSVGGFHVDSQPENIAPVKLDVNSKPAPPSETLRAGGAKLKLTLRLDEHYFESESVGLKIDGNEVAQLNVDTGSNEQESFIEVPAGIHTYELKGQASYEDGEQEVIAGSGVILVSNQTMREKFDALVAEHGLALGTERFIKNIDDLSDRLSLSPLVFTKSAPWNDQQLDEAEKKLGLRLPESYRSLMKTIGPFQIKHPDVPHPVVSLLSVDAERNLESFVQQVLKDDVDELPTSAYSEIVEEASFMKAQLENEKVLKVREMWRKNLLVGSAEEHLYLLVGESYQGKLEEYSILWTPLFDLHEDDDGEQLPYFQWAEYCGGEDKAADLLADAIFSTLSKHYDLQGVAPLVPDESGQVTMALISTLDTEDDTDGNAEENEKLIYGISTDYW